MFYEFSSNWVVLIRQLLLTKTLFAKFQVDFPLLSAIFKSSSAFESLFGYSATFLHDIPILSNYENITS